MGLSILQIQMRLSISWPETPCMKPFLRERLAVSVISFMELLSYPAITAEEEKVIRQFLAFCEILSIDEQVRERTILLRKRHRVKLPDSIIAATAMTNGLSLLTADAGFFRIDGLHVEKLEP